MALRNTSATFWGGVSNPCPVTPPKGNINILHSPQSSKQNKYLDKKEIEAVERTTVHIYFPPHIPTRSHSPQVRGTTQSLILPCPAYKLDFTSTRSRATPWGRLTWPPKLTRLMCNNARRPIHYFTTTTVNVTQARGFAWLPPVRALLAGRPRPEAQPK